MASHDVSKCLAKLLQKPVGGKVKRSFSPRKAFNADFCSFNERMPSSSDKNAATAASMLTSSAAARLTIACCITCWSSSMAFKGSFQLPAFVTVERALIDRSILTQTDRCFSR